MSEPLQDWVIQRLAVTQAMARKIRKVDLPPISASQLAALGEWTPIVRQRDPGDPLEIGAAVRVDARIPTHSMTTAIEHIQIICARVWGVRATELRGRSHQSKVSHPRHAAMVLARTLLDPTPSYPAIACAFRRKDHTTVMKAEALFRGRIRDNRPLYAEMVAKYREAERRVRDALGKDPESAARQAA